MAESIKKKENDGLRTITFTQTVDIDLTEFSAIQEKQFFDQIDIRLRKYLLESLLDLNWHYEEFDEVGSKNLN